jgi:isopentenyl-diphosphate delta-isomerase
MAEEDESVILVDEQDHPVGAAQKLDAHRSAKLHRAFSIFISGDDGNILIHRRADGKYHSSGFWTNACCGHPRPGEDTLVAAHRRLREEMGITCELEEKGAFIYRAAVDNGLTEHELDHVFVGSYNGDPDPAETEVQDWRWIPVSELSDWLAREPEAFTVWFEQALYVSGLGTMRSSTFAEDNTPGTPPPG